jgi:hypothetical protein
VRAATAIPAGSEVCISYLGDAKLQPLTRRREELAPYCFTCSCPRCAFEEKLPEHVTQQLLAAATPVVWKGQSEDSLKLARSEWAGILAAASECCDSHKQKLMLLGSCWALVEHLALGPWRYDHEVTLVALEVLQEVAPATSQHTRFAALSLQKAEGSDMVAASQCAIATLRQQCLEAHRLRYGAVSQELLSALVECSRVLHKYCA